MPKSDSSMKVITVNLPEPFLVAMRKLIEEYGLYPSRSELVRVAVREFVLHELQVLDRFEAYREGNSTPNPSPALSPAQNSDMRTIRNFHNFRGAKH